ncbi:hypothetical protein ABFS82_11G014100 [Erythranthe guttata]
MWAFRRASIHIRNRELNSGIARIRSVKSDTAICYSENYNTEIVESHRNLLDASVYSTRSFNASPSSSNSYMNVRTLFSKAGAKSRVERDDDLEDAFSELEAPLGAVGKAASADDIDDLMSESDLYEGESVTTEGDAEKKSFPKTNPHSAFTKAVLGAPIVSVVKVLDQWVKEGNELTKPEVSSTMVNLRKRRMFVKALKMSEWLEHTKLLEFNESNYASRVDLIVKVHGIPKAEEYIKRIPESFRGEIVYRTLLANCVSTGNVKKSEDLFNKMKSLFPITCFSCNQLLLLYKRTDNKKISNVLSLMEKENIKPSYFTYHVLISAKGLSNDISGMEKIVEKMKTEGVEPNTIIQVSLARYYAIAGLKDKAKAVCKEIEGEDITKNRWACGVLLPIYASLRMEDEVERIWKVCQSDLRTKECLAAIEAWGQLKRIEDAESAFDKMMKILKKPTSKHFAALIKIYADHKMLDKGKGLVKRMSESGCSVGPLTWDALVKLYVGAGEVEKADSILEKAVKQKSTKPLCSSFLTILDEYANRGDIHNAEKIFVKIREAGFASRVRPYRSLLYAYINAKAPSYGFRERMKGDNVVPNAALVGLLARTDAFRKSPLDELLE